MMPYWKASLTYSNISKALMTMTNRFGDSALARFISSRPDIRGMQTSVSSKSTGCLPI